MHTYSRKPLQQNCCYLLDLSAQPARPLCERLQGKYECYYRKKRERGGEADGLQLGEERFCQRRRRRRRINVVQKVRQGERSSPDLTASSSSFGEGGGAKRASPRAPRFAGSLPRSGFCIHNQTIVRRKEAPQKDNNKPLNSATICQRGRSLPLLPSIPIPFLPPRRLKS